MPNKMERFTQRARRVLVLAQEEAERLLHKGIDSEHMLMGLMREEGEVAGKVLRDLGVQQEQLETLISESAPDDAEPLAAGKSAELTADCKRILELAVDEARRMGHHYIGTEHLIVGLVRQTDSKAVNILKQLNISPEAVRRQVRRVLEESPLSKNQPPAEPISENRQQTTRLSADAYDMLRTVLMKILDMIADGKLPATHGIELFNALTPDLRLAPIQQAEMINQLFEQKTIADYSVRLTEMDSTGKATSETTLSLDTVLKEIDRFLAITIGIGESDNPLVYQFGEGSLEVRIVRNAGVKNA